MTYQDDYDRSPRTWMRCGQDPPAFRRCECSYVGWMALRMTGAGCHASVQGPAEEAVYAAVCPQCGLEHDEYGDGS